MQKKYQVFVSSTFRDLSDERQDAIRSILDLGHIPAGMELFPAADTEQLVYIKKVIDECDYYVLIMGGRYGSLDSEGISFTEREYDYAVETGKVVLAFPHGDLAAIPVGKSESGDRMRANLEQFRAKVMEGRLVREWKSREQLESLVVKALVHAVSNYPAVGWIRGDTAASEDLLRQLNTLQSEAHSLRIANAELSAVMQPKLENLASGEEEVTLRFSYSTRGPRGSEKREQSFDFTWDELFLAIARNLAVPRVTELISSYITNHINENRGWKNRYFMFESDQVIVKSQLVALGLIDAYVGKSNGNSHEFMRLTAPGQRKLSEALAVKSARESEPASATPS